MRQSKGTLTTAAVALGIYASLFGYCASAKAESIVSGLTSTGWNLIQPSQCLQVLYNGTTALYIYPTSGGYLATNEKDLVSAASTYCAYGDLFYAYTSNGSAWEYVYYFPSLNN